MIPMDSRYHSSTGRCQTSWLRSSRARYARRVRVSDAIPYTVAKLELESNSHIVNLHTVDVYTCTNKTFLLFWIQEDGTEIEYFTANINRQDGCYSNPAVAADTGQDIFLLLCRESFSILDGPPTY